jgi:hypothetical protein
MTDLFHRIRWANVARAAALLLAVLLALAWPRLRSHDDDLPPALAEPVTVGGGSATEGPEEHPREATHAKHGGEAMARRKAAHRRTTRETTAKRAKRRRRTVARRRAAARPAAGAATSPRGTGPSPNRRAAPSWRPTPRPASPAAEFRP